MGESISYFSFNDSTDKVLTERNPNLFAEILQKLIPEKNPILYNSDGERLEYKTTEELFFSKDTTFTDYINSKDKVDTIVELKSKYQLENINRFGIVQKLYFDYESNKLYSQVTAIRIYGPLKGFTSSKLSKMYVLIGILTKDNLPPIISSEQYFDKFRYSY